MAPDKVTLKEEVAKHDYFSLLILGSGKESINALKEVYDKPIELEILVNGERVLLKDFRDTMEDWGNRIHREYQEKYDRLTKESSPYQLAEKILKDKLQHIRDHLDKLEDVCQTFDYWGEVE